MVLFFGHLTGTIRALAPPRIGKIPLGASRWFTSCCTSPSRLPGLGHPMVLTHPVVVGAAPGLPRASRVELPPASASCCDRPWADSSFRPDKGASWRMHGPCNTVPCMSKGASVGKSPVFALDLAGDRFEAAEDVEPAEVAKGDVRGDGLAGESGHTQLALRPGQYLGGSLSLAALAEVAWATGRLIAGILPSHERPSPYSYAISGTGLRRTRPGEGVNTQWCGARSPGPMYVTGVS